MNRIFKTAVLSAAVAATMLVALPAANADEWRHHRHHGNGDAIAAGVLGLAAGALIGGALANDRPPPDANRYYDDGYYNDGYYDREVRVRPAPVRRVSLRAAAPPGSSRCSAEAGDTPLSRPPAFRPITARA